MIRNFAVQMYCSMRNDISSRADIQLLIDSFYQKVRQDEVIGYIFNDIAKVDWPHHLPRMYDFWEDIAFQKNLFTGNPMTVHLQLHQKEPFQTAHFDRWLELFLSTVDELFDGERAELVKQRARSIATIMQIKIKTPPGGES